MTTVDINTCTQWRKWISESYPFTGLDTLQRLQDVKALRILKHSAQEGDNIFSPKHRSSLPPRKILATPFL